MSERRGVPNALKHGAYTRKVLLWGEKREDYEVLRAACFKEYYPDGPSEEYLVESIVELLWRRRRLVRYDEIILKDRLTGIRTNNKNYPFWAALFGLAGSFAKLTSAEEVEKQLALVRPRYRNYIVERWPLATDGDPKTWGATIAKGLAALRVPTVHEKGAEFIAAFDPVPVELVPTPLARIDAEIERALKRLMHIKVTKQALYRLHPQLITISSSSKPMEDDKSGEPSG